MIPEKIIFAPIGYAEQTALKSAKNYELPAQGYMDDLEYRIILLAGQNFEQGLKDLAGFSHIWVIFHFGKSKSWNPLVIPPRGPAQKRGVFATRSPHRPNGIGMTLVKLEKIEGRTLFVRGGDFFDHTPVLDIKPYISASDSAADVQEGWVKDLEEHRWEVLWSSELQNSLDKFKDMDGFGLKKYVDKVLSYSREAHPYRRIKLLSPERGVLSVKRWRVAFFLNPAEKKVIIEKTTLSDE